MDSTFAANELRQFPRSLFLSPTFRTILLLDGIQPIEVTEKGRDSDQYCREHSGKNVECGKKQKGSDDAVQGLKYQRAGKPFDI